MSAKISAEPLLTNPDGTEVIPVVKGGVNMQLPLNQLPIGAALDRIIGGVQTGDVLYRGATGWTRLPASSLAGASAGPVAAANAALPSISPGSAQVGTLLTCDPGVWTGSPIPTFAYQWQYADTQANIAGATGKSYLPTTSDVGRPLRCRVTGSNGVGGAVAVFSPATVSVIAATSTAAPSVVTGPTISGQAVDGGVLSLNTGTWSGSPQPTFARQWIYADTGGAIPNQTGTTLTISAARDAGHTIACVVTGSNGVGNPVTVTTAATAIVQGLAPVNTAAPQLNPGFGAVGDTLAVLNGSWSSTDAITYSYKWFQADTSTQVATTATYTLQAADAGHFMRCEIVATNRWGASAPASTSWSGQITGTTSGGGTSGSGTTPTSPPSVVSPPVISGSAAQGSALSVTQGVYNG